ncbi:MAG: T9SS type A sorting domain-containing protein, partial [Ferruginibacter sp.]
IVLKGLTNTDNIFKVSTLVQSEIIVNAAVPYQYQLMDMNGRVINKGTGNSGYNNINISNQPGGIYIIQLLSNNKQQTERILKQ